MTWPLVRISVFPVWGFRVLSLVPAVVASGKPHAEAEAHGVEAFGVFGSVGALDVVGAAAAVGLCVDAGWVDLGVVAAGAAGAEADWPGGVEPPGADGLAAATGFAGPPEEQPATDKHVVIRTAEPMIRINGTVLKA
jgi:hypothetical protein